jgi:hypothetical protein
MDEPTIRCPLCPLCGWPPAFVLAGAVQAFCGNEACPAAAWNPSETAAANLHVEVADLPGLSTTEATDESPTGEATESTVEIGGQVMTPAQYDAARFPLIDELARLRAGVDAQATSLARLKGFAESEILDRVSAELGADLRAQLDESGGRPMDDRGRAVAEHIDRLEQNLKQARAERDRLRAVVDAARQWRAADSGHEATKAIYAFDEALAQLDVSPDMGVSPAGEAE